MVSTCANTTISLSIRSTGTKHSSFLPLINIACWILFAVVLLFPGIRAFKQLVDHRQRTPERAFIFFYSMGRMLNDYPPEQLYNYALQQKVCADVHPLKGRSYGPITYPPYVAVFFKPFSRLPFNSAFALWLALSLLVYLSGLVMTVRRLFPCDFTRQSLAYCLALSFLPFMWVMIGGQIPIFGFLGLALALREEERQRPFASGLALSLCLYKPTFVVLLLPMLLATRRVKTIAGMASGGLVLAAVATVAEGAGVWSGYVRLLLTFGSAAVHGHSFSELKNYMDVSAFLSLLPGGQSSYALVIAGAVILASIIGLVLTWLKSRKASGSVQALVLATTVTWTLVLNVYVPTYDAVLVVPGAMTTVAWLRKSEDTVLARWFNATWITIFLASWIATQFANSNGIQILTPLYILLGSLQLMIVNAACRLESRENFSRLRQPSSKNVLSAEPCVSPAV